MRDREYDSSLQAFHASDVKRARSTFPRGESGGFVTSVEQSWLGVWDQDWQPRLLISHTEAMDVALRFEHEPDYVPAEYETVIMYLVQATHWLKHGHVEAAQVELRRAGWVLERQWDDQGLRLWLAALWLATGSWDEARVDLRRAHELGGAASLLALASEDHPPEELFLHFYGAGPRLEWTNGIYKPNILICEASPNIPVAASATHWYARHLKTDHGLRDVTRVSSYSAQLVGTQALSLIEAAGAKIASFGVRGLGVGVGGAGLVAGAAVGGELANLLISLSYKAGSAIWREGERLDHKWSAYLQDWDRQKQEDLHSYRMVRYLPNWVGLSLKDSPADLHVERIPLSHGVALLHHF